MYVPHLLNPFLYQWTFRLFPCLGYRESCCYEHTVACIFLNCGFIQIYAQEWDCWIIWQFCIKFSEELPYCFPQWLYQFICPPTVQEGNMRILNPKRANEIICFFSLQNLGSFIKKKIQEYGSSVKKRILMITFDVFSYCPSLRSQDYF